MESLRLLLVDSDLLILHGTGEALSREGFEVTGCSSGREAVSLIKESPFEVIITDLAVNDGGGLEVLRFAKQRDPNSMVILFSGYGDSDSIISALRNDADDYIIKPVRNEELIFRINRVLEKRGLRVQNQQLRREVSEQNRELIRINTDLVREVEERKLAEERIRMALAEKEILIREIHHRVKNNLAMVASLINLKSRDIDDPEVLQLFNELKQRIKAIRMVHEKIYRGSAIAGIVYSEYLKELLEDTLSGLNPTSRPVELKVESEQIMMDLDTSIPLGIAVTELASNSLKHAFLNFQGEEKKGEIRVRFVTEGDDCILTYSDNGPGIPDSEKSGSEDGTLGMRLVAALSRQIGGNLNFVESGGVQIRFPKPAVP